MKSYTHFTQEERESIYLLLKLNKNLTEIAAELGRHKSSVSREIRRNSSINGQYNPWGAYSKYHFRRRKCRRHARICFGSQLYDYIIERLKKYYSPEIIATKWNIENPDDRISFSTIYKAIKSGVFEGISVKSHLRRKGKRRYGKKRGKYNTIKPEHTIHERPEEANQRLRIGDWEGDTVSGAKGKGCIVTLVDRKSRKLLSAKSKDMSAQSVLKAIKKAFGTIKPKTITLDNGSEFSKFKDLERALNTTVYFADPHAPWQRGTNENINDCIRFFFPKGFDFDSISDKELQYVVELINDRPRLCLGLLSPNEVFC